MSITPEQVKAARRLLGWSQADLALNSAVSHAAIREIEAKQGGRLERAVANLRATLEAAGVEFIAEDGGGTRVRLRKPK